MSSAKPLRAVPVKNALAPDVDKSNREHKHKGQHLKVRLPTKLHEGDGPRIEKDDFDIKQDEKHRNQIEAHIEALIADGSYRDGSALEGKLLGAVLIPRPDHRFNNEHGHQEKGGGDHEENDNS